MRVPHHRNAFYLPVEITLLPQFRLVGRVGCRHPSLDRTAMVYRADPLSVGILPQLCLPRPVADDLPSSLPAPQDPTDGKVCALIGALVFRNAVRYLPR